MLPTSTTHQGIKHPVKPHQESRTTSDMNEYNYDLKPTFLKGGFDKRSIEHAKIVKGRTLTGF